LCLKRWTAVRRFHCFCLNFDFCFETYRFNTYSSRLKFISPISKTTIAECVLLSIINSTSKNAQALLRGRIVCSHLNNMKLRRFIQLLHHVFLFILEPNSITCPVTLYSYSYRPRTLENLSIVWVMRFNLYWDWTSHCVLTYCSNS
jgi:hypothetical protein